MAILNAFGQSFMQPDIMVFKQNLAALEVLNEKWKIYHKVQNRINTKNPKYLAGSRT